jgi:hypothetical protein
MQGIDQHIIILKNLACLRLDDLEKEQRGLAIKLRCNYDLCREDHDHKPSGFVAEEHCMLFLRGEGMIVEKAHGGQAYYDVLGKTKEGVTKKIQVKSHTASSYCLSGKGTSWGYSIFQRRTLAEFDELVVALVGDTFSILMHAGEHPGRNVEKWPKTDRFLWSKFLGKERMQRAIDTSRKLWGRCYDDLDESMKREISKVF